ncbi:MAG: hypothetical protein F4Z97_05880 [Gammaproteobacteria bacterium]|nr:hypothetical protein [Gammaproteobacteria bacterium]
MYSLLTQTGRLFLSAIHFVILLMLVLFLAQACAQAQTYEAGGCYDIDSSTIQWQIMSKWQARFRPWLWLSERVEGKPGYFIGAESGRCLGRINHHFARIAHVCRHPVSDRVHILIYALNGDSPHYIEIWSTDPASGNPVRDYFEVWEDLALMGARMEEMVAADDICLWQKTQ